MDLIQIGLTLLAIFCAYQRGASDGFDYAMEFIGDDDEEKG